MLDESEKRISQLLEARYGDVAARAFRGGIEVLGHTNDDRMHQSAHSLREVLSMILRHERKNNGKKTSAKKENGGKMEYGLTMDHARSGGLIRSPEDSLIKGLTDINRDLQRIAHHSERTSNHEYETLVTKYKNLLEDFLRLHFDSINELDFLMDIANPTRADFEKLRLLLSKNTSAYAYFFQNADSNWLDRLAVEGYIPPPPTLGEHLVTACRAQSVHLARHSAKNPGLVAKLFASLLKLGGAVHDPMVQLHAVRAALSMPPNCALPIARQMRPCRGVRPFPRSIATEETASLVVRLAESGHVDDAVSLARALLSVRHRTQFIAWLPYHIVTVRGYVEPDITDYFFSRALKAVAPPLFQIAPRPATKLLAGLLARIIRLENMTRSDGERNADLSMHWRPAMEDHPQNHLLGFKSDLAGMLAALLVDTGKRSIHDLKDALQEITAKGYPAFRRIELHVYRSFPDHFDAQINTAIVDCFGLLYVRHEYYHLLNSCFPLISEGTRKNYLDMVLTGPGASYMKRARELEQLGRGPSVKESVRRWKARRLAPVRDHLDKKEKELVGDLVQAPEPAHPDFVVYRGSVRIGVVDTQLKGGMAPDEVIDALRSAYPQGRRIKDSDGTPHTFQNYCESEPREYSLRSARLAGLHPEMQSAFLRAMRAALDKDTDIVWDKVLHLCESAVKSAKDGRIERDDAVHIVDAVSYLLYSALGKDRMDYRLRERVWKVVCSTAAVVLGDDLRAWDARGAGPAYDGMTALLNSPGAMAFLAVGRYAAWCSRHSDTRPYFVPEARQLFESYLDNDRLHTPPRHAAVGHLLPSLYWYDREWIRGRLRSVFGAGAGTLAQAAWAGYLSSDPDPSVFGDVIHMYRAAVSSPLPTPPEEARDFMTYNERLINHVVQGHLLRMGDTDDIFDTLAKKSNRNTRSHCAWIVYLILKGHRENPLESLDPGRFREIWARNQLGPHEFLARWAEFSPLDPGETLSLLHKALKMRSGGTTGAMPMMLIEGLQRFLGEHPSMVLACLEEMAVDDAMREEFAHADKVLPDMLKALLAAGDTRDRAAKLVHLLGEMGHNKYGRLLGGEASG